MVKGLFLSRSEISYAEDNQSDGATLSARIDRDLLDWAKSYARSNGTTLSQLVREFLEHLRKEAETGDGVSQA